MATEIKERSETREHYDVGGIRLERPFRIRRMGHFGFNCRNVEGNLHFYGELLGLYRSDPIDFGARVADKSLLAGKGSTIGWFMRHGTDHHSFVVFPGRVLDVLAGRPDHQSEVTINQITWQVGSLREVTEATRWLGQRHVKIRRVGRDTPGSNWHCYPIDPDEHVNELYYGIEQVGWNGHSKPRAMYARGFQETPSLPQISEFREVEDAMAQGIDIGSGYRSRPVGEARYDVGGILLPRPFKIVRVGPVHLFVKDVETSVRYYRDVLGLQVSEEITWQGHTCVFLRCNTEHHSVGLYPIALRAVLGLSAHTTCLSFGMQLAEYRQLRDAVSWLGERGVTIKHLPPELFPGIEHSAFAIDVDGHAIQLYHAMEQIGWDGRPRPAALRRKIDNGNWPEFLDPLSDSYMGEAYLGPWG
ncbi:MAG: extradiol dioxygenase [Alphaproteobacteria bacterium]|nr:extradiol dioxygenase [Alphaproteobacteria bacterium]